MNGYAGYLIERRKLLQVEPTHYALYLCFRDNVAKISQNVLVLVRLLFLPEI